MQKLTRLIVVAWTASTILALFGCSKPVEPITLGINPWPGYEFLYLAKEKGFYKELGVPVKIIEYGSLSDVRRGYERGNLDILTSTVIEVLQIRSNSNRDPRIFMVADFSFGGDVILARKPIQSPVDLKGKRVGADTTSLPIFLLARALETNGLTLKDVTVVPLEQSDLEQAYSKGELDAVVTYPPVSVHLQKRDDTNVIFTSKSIPGEIMDVISVDASVLQRRPEDIRKIVLAWDKALEFARLHPQEAHAIMAKREGITASEFAEALTDIQVVTLAEQARYMQLVKPILQRVRDVLVTTGALPANSSAECCIADTNFHQN